MVFILSVRVRFFLLHRDRYFAVLHNLLPQRMGDVATSSPGSTTLMFTLSRGFCSMYSLPSHSGRHPHLNEFLSMKFVWISSFSFLSLHSFLGVNYRLSNPQRKGWEHLIARYFVPSCNLALYFPFTIQVAYVWIWWRRHFYITPPPASCFRGLNIFSSFDSPLTYHHFDLIGWCYTTSGRVMLERLSFIWSW